MLRIDIITALPELLISPFRHSILKRAIDRKLLTIEVIDLRQYGLGKHRQIDDYQYGGGAGMVLMVEPIYNCIHSLRKERPYDEIIYMSPDGDEYTQQTANLLSMANNLIILCGHYKGIDERIREHLITREISIGEYVLSGGELAAAVVVDSIGRLLPGALNNEESALLDSYQDGLIAPPVYTRPSSFKGWEVPEVLLSGHQKNINSWREKQSLKRTAQKRPELLD